MLQLLNLRHILSMSVYICVGFFYYYYLFACFFLCFQTQGLFYQFCKSCSHLWIRNSSLYSRIGHILDTEIILVNDWYGPRILKYGSLTRNHLYHLFLLEDNHFIILHIDFKRLLLFCLYCLKIKSMIVFLWIRESGRKWFSILNKFLTTTKANLTQ